MGPCPFGPSLSARFGLFVLTTVQKHIRVPTHSDLAHRIPQSGSASSCFAPLASPMRPGVKRPHEGGAVTSTPLGWEWDESPHPHVHPVIKDRVCLCLSSPWMAPSFERTGHTPLRTARAGFPACRSSLSNALLRTRWCHAQRLVMDLSMAVGMQEHTVVCCIATPMRPPDDMVVVPSRQAGDFLAADWA